MRRAFLLGLASVLVVAGAIVALGSGKADGKTYKIVFDNAFGLTKGADFKVAGVAVGAISDLDVQRSDDRALVTVTVSKADKSFAGLRSTSSCTIKPQSLIGEYFVDCEPGTSGPLLKSGARVPVTRTTSPIPPDLVLDIMRRPIAQRFSIIFSELGAGFAARGNDINQTIRRAIPALQTTDQVLKLLARKRETLQALSRESGVVLKVLGRRHEDVTDFVTQAKNAASATADRRRDVALTFHRFPGFLDQLTPTMRDLGTAARQLTPALADLRIAAPSVTGLLNTLRPFAQASLPAVTSLGSAGKAGRIASQAARRLIARLHSLGNHSPEPAKNLRIILAHLDNRKFAVEKNKLSPGGRGYTGLEAPLQYIFDQSLSANTFDQRGYALKINITAGECGNYTDAAGALADKAKYASCNQNLGPNQPCITADTSASYCSTTATRSARTRRTHRTPRRPGSHAATPGTAGPAASAAPAAPLQPVHNLINQIVDKIRPPVQKVADPTNDLLDFLLRP